jgi:hypothetical protein
MLLLDDRSQVLGIDDRGDPGHQADEIGHRRLERQQPVAAGGGDPDTLILADELGVGERTQVAVKGRSGAQLKQIASPPPVDKQRVVALAENVPGAIVGGHR